MIKIFIRRVFFVFDVWFTMKRAKSAYIVIKKLKNGDFRITESATMHTFSRDLGQNHDQ